MFDCEFLVLFLSAWNRTFQSGVSIVGMMKYLNGSRVEVLRSRERASGCWRPGEIISGDGTFYIVRFDCYGCCGSSALVQRVLPRSIRPCPPIVDVPRLRCGDVVEVFVDFGWKTATVWKVMRKHYIWVMQGPCEKIRVRKGDVRMKQSWQNDEWVALVQRSYTSVQGKKTSNVNLICNSEMKQTNLHCNLKVHGRSAAPRKTNNRTHEAKLKRKSPCSYVLEPCLEAAEKCRAIEKYGLAVRAPVSAMSSKGADPGTRYPHTETREWKQICPFWRKLWFPKVNPVRENPFDMDTTVSSVDSCSITSQGTHKLHHHKHTPKGSKECNGYVSDAESFYRCCSKEENYLQPNSKAISVEVQRCKAASFLACPCDMFLKLILVFAVYAVLR
uniref:Agenet domain-containing protein n=2 Tax=Kalanchoe fedtschenkoi TaxID=63787 RepID=A0A7N0TEN2_KALFE